MIILKRCLIAALIILAVMLFRSAAQDRPEGSVTGKVEMQAQAFLTKSLSLRNVFS